MNTRLSVTIIAALWANISVAHQPPIATQPQIMQVIPLQSETLNVRASPFARSEDIGDLAGGAGPLAILEVSDNGRWGRILWQEGSGWIATAYLEPANPAMFAGTNIPVGLSCHGTEPFWAIQVERESITLSSPEHSKGSDYTLQDVVHDENNSNGTVAIIADSNDTQLSLLVKPAHCSDGMSDSQWGWSSTVIVQNKKNNRLLSGCCGLPSPNSSR